MEIPCINKVILSYPILSPPPPPPPQLSMMENWHVLFCERIYHGFWERGWVNFFLCLFFNWSVFFLGLARCATGGRYWVTLQRNDEVVTTYVSFQFLLISSHESMSLSTHGVFPILHRRPKLIILCYAPQHTRVYKRLLLHYESQKKWNCFSKFFGGAGMAGILWALASHQCGPGSIPGLDVICGLSLLLVLVLAPRVLLRVLRFSSLHKNQHFQIPIRSGIRGPQVCQSSDC